MESCSVQELIKFDVTKPMAPFGKQLLIAMLSVVLNNLIFNFIVKFITPDNNQYEEDVDEEFTAIKSKMVSPFLFGFSEMVNGGIYAPIVEELFFRFLLFKLVFIKVFKMNSSLANVVQAVVFGLLHLSNIVSSDQQIQKSMLQTLSATIGGFISGWTYMYTNSIFTPMMAHMINNIIATSSDTIEYTQFYTKSS